jgi:cold shock CspA family protein
VERLPGTFRGAVAAPPRGPAGVRVDDGLVLFTDAAGEPAQALFGAGRLLYGACAEGRTAPPAPLAPGDAVEFELARNAATGALKALAVRRAPPAAPAPADARGAALAAAARGAPPDARALGRVVRLKRDFGFVRQAALPGDVFFHFSQLGEELLPPAELRVGDDVEFTVRRDREGKLSAHGLRRAPPGAAVFDTVDAAPRRGVVAERAAPPSAMRGPPGGPPPPPGVLEYELSDEEDEAAPPAAPPGLGVDGDASGAPPARPRRRARLTFGAEDLRLRGVGAPAPPPRPGDHVAFKVSTNVAAAAAAAAGGAPPAAARSAGRRAVEVAPLRFAGAVAAANPERQFGFIQYVDPADLPPVRVRLPALLTPAQRAALHEFAHERGLEHASEGGDGREGEGEGGEAPPLRLALGPPGAAATVDVEAPEGAEAFSMEEVAAALRRVLGLDAARALGAAPAVAERAGGAATTAPVAPKAQPRYDTEWGSKNQRAADAAAAAEAAVAEAAAAAEAAGGGAEAPPAAEAPAAEAPAAPAAAEPAAVEAPTAEAAAPAPAKKEKKEKAARRAPVRRVFFHFSAVLGGELLGVGDEVAFGLHTNPKGPPSGASAGAGARGEPVAARVRRTRAAEAPPVRAFARREAAPAPAAADAAPAVNPNKGRFTRGPAEAGGGARAELAPARPQPIGPEAGGAPFVLPRGAGLAALIAAAATAAPGCDAARAPFAGMPLSVVKAEPPPPAEAEAAAEGGEGGMARSLSIQAMEFVPGASSGMAE